MENNPAMKAFFRGLAIFWDSFWKKAANQGMLVMTLLAMIIGLIFWVDNRNTEISEQRLEFKAEIAVLRNEYRQDIYKLSLVIDSMRQGLDDCNTARIRVEAQNATLMSILKIKQKR